jgi:redox-sensitive bicupin YhaK (pirin superfamily)
MVDTRTLLYIFRGKVEVEETERFGATQRARVLQNCTASVVYMLAIDGSLKTYTGAVWRTVTEAPEEIKLAAMLV